MSKDAGLKLQVLSAGKPEQVNLTVPVKATIDDTEMVVPLVMPRELNKTPAGALLDTRKSGEASNGGLVEPA